jgi:hypothetical protein
MFPIYLLLLSFLLLQATLPLRMPAAAVAFPLCSWISAVAVVPLLLTPIPVLAPLLLLLVRSDPGISAVDDVPSAASTPTGYIGDKKNRKDVNGSTDAINSKLTRTITEKQQQQGDVLADASNRHLPGSSRTSNRSTGC